MLNTFTGELPYTAMTPQAVAGMQAYISTPELPQQHVTSIHKYNYTCIYWEKVVEWLEHVSTASGEDSKKLFGAIKTDA